MNTDTQRLSGHARKLGIIDKVVSHYFYFSFTLLVSSIGELHNENRIHQFSINFNNLHFLLLSI